MVFFWIFCDFPLNVCFGELHRFGGDRTRFINFISTAPAGLPADEIDKSSGSVGVNGTKT